MGWVSSADPVQGMPMNDFSTKEEAIAYAERNGFDYVLSLPNKPTFKRKSYGENFRYEPTRVRLVRSK